MTERTPSQVNASLDNAWALIQELQSANRAHVRAHADLCLRVSQNHDRHEKDLAALKPSQNQDAARVSKLEAAAEVARLQRDQLKCELMALTERVEQIDAVLDHDTSQMRHATLASILDSLIKRIDALELKPPPSQGVSSEGVVHNFNSADSLGPATVTLDPLADSRGLSVCIDGHHMRGHFLIIPWEAIDRKRAQRDKAAESSNPGYPSAQPWWSQKAPVRF
jgi:hypothetical protein